MSWKFYIFIGKRCPISGVFCVLSTVTAVATSYLMGAPEFIGSNGEFAKYMFALPFLKEWQAGECIKDLIVHNFDTYWVDVLNLIIICTISALLQYISCSYKATLFTQIIGRFLIIFSLIVVIPMCVNCVMVWVVPDWIAQIEYIYFSILIAILLFLLFYLAQPWICLYGILSAFLFVWVFMQLAPYEMMTINGEIAIDFHHYLKVVLPVMLSNFVLSIIENVVAVLEKTGWSFFKNKIAK